MKKLALKMSLSQFLHLRKTSGGGGGGGGGGAAAAGAVARGVLGEGGTTFVRRIGMAFPPPTVSLSDPPDVLTSLKLDGLTGRRRSQGMYGPV